MGRQGLSGALALVVATILAAGFLTPRRKVIAQGANGVTLVLYGTGIRGRSSLANVQVNIANLNLPVLYAGAQPTIPGLDQVNVSLPSSLQGLGQLVLTVTVDGQATNMVQVAFQ